MLQAVIGIDLGSTKSVISVAKKGVVEILTNEASNRENPCVVGYGQQERFIGEFGQAQKLSNFRNTISNFNRFLGITPDSPYLETEKRYVTVNVVPSADNTTVVFEVNYKGEKRQMTPIQVTASYLQKLKQQVFKSGISNNEYVLSVPSYYTEQERKALQDACKIAEVNNLRFINENAAVCLGYGIFRKAELSADTAKNVIFVDFGHSKTSSYCATFTKDKFKILAQSDERNLGARDIDWILAEHYSKKFNDEHGIGLPIKQAKARLRLLEAIEKQRKVLSANLDSQINCEYLIEDYDLNDTLNREQFDLLIEPVMQRLTNVLVSLRDELQQKKILIQDVEIIGGATRIPYVQRIIQTVFGVNELCRTLNASEAVVKGCVMMCAMNSSFFKVAHYGCEEYNPNPIRCQWIFLDPVTKKTYHYTGMDVEQNDRNNLEKQRAILFDKGCSIPNIKSLTFQRNEPIQLSLYYDKAPAGAHQLLANYIIHPIKQTFQEYNTKVRVKLNANQLIQLEEAHIEETYYEEIPPAKEEKKQENKTEQKKENKENTTEQTAEQINEQTKTEPVVQEELKKKKKTRLHVLNVESSAYNSLSEKQVQQYFELEAEMTNQDKITQDIYERKNYLESYIYNLRGNLQDKFILFTTQDIIQNLLAQLEIEENWIYDDGKNAGKSQFQKKIDALKKIADPIEKRYNEFINTPDYLQNLNQTLDRYCQQVGTIEHLTDIDKQVVLVEANNIRLWLQNSIMLQKNLAQNQDPIITCQEIQLKQNNFINISNPIINKPKPQPPKPSTTTTKTEDTSTDKQQEQENTNMETETDNTQQKQQQQQQPQENMDIEN